MLRVAGLAFTSLLLLAAGAVSGFAHGGPPLRVGVTKDPVGASVARLVLLHLREGVGFAVDWREFPDETGLRAAFAGGGIDIAVGLTDPGQLPPALASAQCPRELLAPLSEALRMRWGGEVYVLGFPAGATDCARPALIVSRSVLEDLRFGILGKESARMASFITRGDVDAVRAAAERGGERAATAAARAALAAKTSR
jgi:hypothetical protein